MKDLKQIAQDQNNIAQDILDLEKRLRSLPTKQKLAELIETCEILDAYYKDLCDEIDEENNDEIGRSYREGRNIEFYFEATDWHRISLALRNLRKKK